MNRQIKFRGKRLDNGEWIYGNLVYMHGLGDTWTTGIQIQSGDGYRAWASINVKPETVGQYTGLTDRNGKEIYEGDILSVQGGNEHQGYREFNETGCVEFSTGSFWFTYQSHGQKVYADFDHFDKEDVEVFSNIYEHPELLEG